MSLDSNQLVEHCHTIMKMRSISKKIVVLCEGYIHDIIGIKSPQVYARHNETMPDSSFYKKCIPSKWTQYRPEFIICGGQSNVLNTYFKLLELHQKPNPDSYLDTIKLFALVDLDLKNCPIENYHFSDIEQIFHHLYNGMNVNETNASQHRIWVTGLIHKEAYFILPELQTIFDNHPIKPIYNNNPLQLENIYSDMADDMISDGDLQNNLAKACKRINYCTDLDCSNINQLQDSWKDKFQKLRDQSEKEKMIFALLTIRKAKEYWRSKITPGHEWTRSGSDYRDQLLLKIAKFYSEQGDNPNPKYHLSVFFKILYQKFLEGK